MQDLIVITTNYIDDEIIQTVNASDLHSFLESKQDFSTWIKNRIELYGFVENQDFILNHKIVEQVSVAKYLIEYHVTLDMAKELSMVERNAKGKEARKYFIECERIAKEKASRPKKTQLELAREQVVLLERLEQIAIERDLAIATKCSRPFRASCRWKNGWNDGLRRLLCICYLRWY